VMGRHTDTTALQKSTGRLLRASAVDIVLEHTSPEDAAVIVLAQPAIVDALAAVDVVTELRARHQPRPWAPDSPTVACTCGSGSFEGCPDARILGVSR
jgi:hypothetical protein